MNPLVSARAEATLTSAQTKPVESGSIPMASRNCSSFPSRERDRSAPVILVTSSYSAGEQAYVLRDQNGPCGAGILTLETRTESRAKRATVSTRTPILSCQMELNAPYPLIHNLLVSPHTPLVHRRRLCGSACSLQAGEAASALRIGPSRMRGSQFVGSKFGSSDLLIIECQRVLQRERMAGHLDDQQFSKSVVLLEALVDRMHLIQIGTAVKRRAAGPFSTVIGMLGAIHLATAALWQEMEGDSEFRILTHDRQLALCTRALGLQAEGAWSAEESR